MLYLFDSSLDSRQRSSVALLSSQEEERKDSNRGYSIMLLILYAASVENLCFFYNVHLRLFLCLILEDNTDWIQD